MVRNQDAYQKAPPVGFHACICWSGDFAANPQPAADGKRAWRGHSFLDGGGFLLRNCVWISDYDPAPRSGWTRRRPSHAKLASMGKMGVLRRKCLGSPPRTHLELRLAHTFSKHNLASVPSNAGGVSDGNQLQIGSDPPERSVSAQSRSFFVNAPPVC